MTSPYKIPEPYEESPAEGAARILHADRRDKLKDFFFAGAVVLAGFSLLVLMLMANSGGPPNDIAALCQRGGDIGVVLSSGNYLSGRLTQCHTAYMVLKNATTGEWTVYYKYVVAFSAGGSHEP